MKYLNVILIILIAIQGFAQNTDEYEDWLPLLDKGFPTRFLTFKLDNKFEHGISSHSSLSEIGDGTSEIKSDRTFYVDLKFPIVNKHDFKLTGGLKYFDEEMAFENEGDYTYPLYESLEDRNLKNLGGNLNGLFHLHGNRSIVARSSFSLAGDFYRSDESFSFSRILKISLAVGYGIKKNPNTFYAFGLYAGYTFGTPSIYPALIWTKNVRSSYGIEAMLPQSIRIWKKASPSCFIYARSKITGNSYTVRLIDNEILIQAESLQLRSSFITSSLGVIQRLSPWFWLESEIGIANNVSFNVSETNFVHNSTLPRPDKNYLIKSKVSGAPYFSISLFVAPPKEFLDKFRN